MVQNGSSAEAVRHAAVAGRFYPADSVKLAHNVQRFLDEATTAADLPALRDVGPRAVAPRAEAPRAVIVPHAGYICSGIVAAASFQTLTALSSDAYTIYLMGPAHWMSVNGVGLSGADSFETPLGIVEVATDRVGDMLRLGETYQMADDAHAPEHCLEVELPFLQTVLHDFRLAPMLFDEAADPDRVADDLCPLLEDDPHSLVVVSSDLSHYLPYKQAQQTDHELLDAIATDDVAAARQGQACGLIPILALMMIAHRLGWTAHVADYRNSGDTCSRRHEVVGYGAVVYTK